MTDADKWNQRYDRNAYFYGRNPNDFLRDQAHALPAGGRVLCLADGEGRNGVWLAEQGFEVTSVDLSGIGLRKGESLAAERQVKLTTVVADLAEYELGTATWDGIVSIWCHLPPELRRDVHRRCVAALKPGGVFLLEAYRPEQLRFGTGGPPVEELMMRLDDLRQELSGLHVEIAHELERHIEEGKGHHGPSAVVQILARQAQAGRR